MLTITPAFSFVPPLQPAFPTQVLTRLHSLHVAAKGDLLAISLGHGVGRRYRSGSASEYWYVIFANGDGQTCDGTVFNMKPEAHVAVEVLSTTWLPDHVPARSYLGVLGKTAGECETLHFKNFTVVIGFAPGCGTEEEAITDIRVLIHAKRSLKTAQQTIAELKALFAFMRELNPSLYAFRIELPGPDELHHAYEEAEPAADIGKHLERAWYDGRRIPGYRDTL